MGAVSISVWATVDSRDIYSVDIYSVDIYSVDILTGSGIIVTEPRKLRHCPHCNLASHRLHPTLPRCSPLPTLSLGLYNYILFKICRIFSLSHLLDLKEKNPSHFSLPHDMKYKRLLATPG